MSKYLAAILVVPAAFAVAGSFEPQTSRVEPPVASVELRQPVRVRLDLARGLRWELGWDAVRAYDLGSGELLRTLRLPGAIFVGASGSCPPDMLLGRTGALFVSSNIQPRLWRISPARFEVEIFDIALESEREKDLGFTSLAWAADEKALLAASTPNGTKWRIDLNTATAARADFAVADRGTCETSAGS